MLRDAGVAALPGPNDRAVRPILLMNSAKLGLLKKVRSKMRRANLLSVAATLVIAVAFTPLTGAQHYHPGQYCDPGMCPPQGGGHPALFRKPQSRYNAPIVDHYVGQRSCLWDDNRPIERFLHDVTTRSWLRMEFLLWDYERPGDGNIGAPVTGLPNLTDTFPAVNREGVNEQLVGEALLPLLNTINIKDTPGIRGTLGVDLNGGDLELSFFGFEQSADSFSASDLQAFRPVDEEALGTVFRPNYALPLLTDGAINDVETANAIIFDESFRAELETQIWGAEMMVLSDPYLPDAAFRWQWLGGFRYLNMDEAFNIRGVYNNGGTAADEVTRISSSTVNNVYGPEVGGRATWEHSCFRFSVTPRVTFGLNDYTAQTWSQDPLTGATTRFTDEDEEFCTITQLSLAGEVQVNPYCSVFAGYDFLWMPHITRPAQNIVYNSTPDAGGGFVRDIRQNVDEQEFYADGFSFGLQFQY